MRFRASRTPLDELCVAAHAAGWWVDLAAEAARRPSETGKLTRLQIRNRGNPDRVKFVKLNGPDSIVGAAAALFLEITDESRGTAA